MKGIHSINIAVLATFLISIVGNSGRVASLTAEQRQLIDTLVGIYMTDNHVPGLGLAIVENNGQMGFSTGYGTSRIASETPATNQTLFAIGSTSKSITSVLAVKVLSEKYPELGGRVLDTPILKLAPNLNFTFSDRFRSEFTTFRDLLAHRTCLSSDGLDLFFGMSTYDEYKYRTRYESESCSFRAGYVYNNNLYALAGNLIAEIAGSTYSKLASSFFQQLGMTDTRLIDEHGSYESLPTMSHAYFRKENQTVQYNTTHLRRLHVGAGAGAILSSAADMSQYLKFHLNKGKVGETQVVPKMAMEWMYTVSNPLYTPLLGLTGAYGYGLGLILAVYNGNPWILHSGYWPPYLTAFGLFPDQQLGIFISINGPGMTGPFSQEVLELLIFDIIQGSLTNLTMIDYEEYTSRMQPAEDDVVLPTGDGNSYGFISTNQTRVDYAKPEHVVGLYGHPAYGEVLISIESDQTLTINFGSWGLGTLTRVSDTGFAIEWTSRIDDDLLSYGNAGPNIFTVDFSVAEEFRFNYTGVLSGSTIFGKDKLINDLPVIPWDESSCGPATS